MTHQARTKRCLACCARFGFGLGFEAKIALRVRGPTTPSASRPWRFWNARTARLVFGPKSPSARIPSARWTRATAGPRLPTLSTSTCTRVAPPEDLARVALPLGFGRAAAHAARTSVAPATRACGRKPGWAAMRFPFAMDAE